jgi:thiamine-phosphate pyrophosphorylase
MDTAIIAWARAVKRRQGPPPLWLFTDSTRLPDPLPVIAALPRGLCGVVFRHDGAPDRGALGRKVAALCWARRLKLVVAGDDRLAAALKAGRHLRGGRGHKHGLTTASAHSIVEVVRARRAGAEIIFISPAFPTASHPGAKALGACRWRLLAARAAPALAFALGGVDAQRLRGLGRACAGAGGIGPFLQEVKLNQYRRKSRDMCQ